MLWLGRVLCQKFGCTCRKPTCCAQRKQQQTVPAKFFLNLWQLSLTEYLTLNGQWRHCQFFPLCQWVTHHVLVQKGSTTSSLKSACSSTVAINIASQTPHAGRKLKFTSLELMIGIQKTILSVEIRDPTMHRVKYRSIHKSNFFKKMWFFTHLTKIKGC